MKCSAPFGKDCSQVFRSQKLTEFCTRLSRKPFSGLDTSPRFQRSQKSWIVSGERSSTEAVQAKRPNFKPPAPADWAKLTQLQRENETVTIEIESLRKNGAVFHLHGAEGFIYFDALAYARVLGGATPTDLVGKKIDVKIIVAEEKGRGLRASEIARLSQDKAAKIAVGDVVEGVVSHCTDFGAFVRIGDGKDLTSVEGMIHISELSWNRVFTPEAVVSPGLVVQCKVVTVDRKQGRIGLSLKRMSPDPLKEQLETLFADESAATTPTKVSPGIERIVKALQDQAGIQDVSLGRQVEEKAVSQELEIWMTTANVEASEFVLIVREGRTVQELNVKSTVSKDEMKKITQQMLQAFG